MSVYIGVDGGGTKTGFLCLSDTGDILGESLAGATNWNSVGPVKCYENLKEGIDKVLLAASVTKEDVKGICLGMSGVDREEDKIECERMIRKIFTHPSLQLLISNDANVACASGNNGSVQGICVISGTGTVCFAYNNGQIFRTAGWGPLLGDRGAGFDIGTSLLKVVTCAEDRRVHSVLSERVLEFLGLDSVWDLIGWAYSEEKVTFSRFASLSRIVLEAASDGVIEAVQILEETADHLFSNFKILYQKAHFGEAEGVRVVLAGGNLVSGAGDTFLSRRVREKFLNFNPNLEIVLPTISASHAAALMIKGLVESKQ
eukprot:TRINITY_DN6322_c0_g1_i3.p1 TRINITY_DN6322_c0_g1~~TRINITY_DN6322_c0_g1_i3.p1  ORF type:complete len:316 (-),score=68.70 TRINITY_DN6322_c0_g1_i3:190-1137(-)